MCPKPTTFFALFMNIDSGKDGYSISDLRVNICRNVLDYPSTMLCVKRLSQNDVTIVWFWNRAFSISNNPNVRKVKYVISEQTKNCIQFRYSTWKLEPETQTRDTITLCSLRKQGDSSQNKPSPHLSQGFLFLSCVFTGSIPFCGWKINFHTAFHLPGDNKKKQTTDVEF